MASQNGAAAGHVHNLSVAAGAGAERGAFFHFTSESVGEGHPDKLCDQISDAVLDAFLAKDPNSKVACEVAAKTGMILVFGEISSAADVNILEIVREKVREIGYDDSAKGLDYKSCSVLLAVEQQSPDIASGLVQHGTNLVDIGAGDQGIMFGYATDETPEMMPLTIILAHKLNMRLSELRRSGVLSYLRPDTKTQVTVLYKIQEDGVPVPQRVTDIVISSQHADVVTTEQIRNDLRKHVVDVVVPSHLLSSDTRYLLQPSGRFVIGGPQGDAGLTGRKIIVDTYGGWGAHGGGAFSGKDWSKVDRSAAYAARWIAKSLIAAKLARRCLVQLSYAIGIPDPVSIFIDTYGTGTRSDADILAIVMHNFKLRPGQIVQELDLAKPIYARTACYGHFGREEFTWEKPKALEIPDSLKNSSGTKQL